MSMEQQAAAMRDTQEYRDAVELIESIRATKNKLALLEASLKQLGDAGQLASIDDMQARLAAIR